MSETILDFATADIDQKIVLSCLLDSFRECRQIAYTASRHNPALLPWFEEAEATYQRFGATLGVACVPVFDFEAHKAKRLAQGDADYTFAYGKAP